MHIAHIIKADEEYQKVTNKLHFSSTHQKHDSLGRDNILGFS